MRLEAVDRTERIGHVRNVARAVLRDLRILVERHGLPVEIAIVLVPMELRDAEGEWRQPVENEEVGAAIETEPDLVVALVARPVPDLVDRVGFGGGQAILRRRVRRAADVRLGAELAGARILDDAVGDAVGGIAGLDGRGRGLRELRGRDRPTCQLLHGDLAPHLRGLESRPVDRRRIGQDALELIAELLCQQISLAPAGRAAVPVIVGRAHAVIGLGDRLRQQHLLLDAVADEIVDELQIVSPVGIDAGLAIPAAVAKVVAGRNVAAVHGRQHRGTGRRDAGTSAAADTLRATVPGALHAALAAVSRA